MDFFFISQSVRADDLGAKAPGIGHSAVDKPVRMLQTARIEIVLLFGYSIAQIVHGEKKFSFHIGAGMKEAGG